MGLDAVEIVMGWEESFGISISDDEAMTLRTPNLAIDLIAKKLGARDEPQRPCLTVRAFHRLRKSIVTVANVPRQSVRPEARLKTLICTDRRHTWDAVRAKCGIASLPSPGWLFEPRTVGDLTRWAVVHATKELKGPGESWTCEIRAARVRQSVLLDHFGVWIHFTKFSGSLRHYASALSS